MPHNQVRGFEKDFNELMHLVDCSGEYRGLLRFKSDSSGPSCAFSGFTRTVAAYGWTNDSADNDVLREPLRLNP